MEYLTEMLGLIAKRDRRHLTVAAPGDSERNDDLCRYITLDEEIHTDIGKGMADAIVVYKYSSGIRYIENLKNSGKLIFVQDEDRKRRIQEYGTEYMKNIYLHSPSEQREEACRQHLLYLKSDAVIVWKKHADAGQFEFYAEEEILKLLGLR